MRRRALAEGIAPEIEAWLSVAARVLPWHAPWGQMGQPIVLYPASVPPDHVDLPLLPRSRLIGSCTSGTYAEVFLDTDEPPQSAITYYRRELEVRGWYLHDMRGESGFLSPGEHAATLAIFCRGAEGPSLQVVPIPRGGDRVDLRLQINSRAGICARPAGRPHFRRTGPRGATPLPALPLPPGALRHRHGTGGGGGMYGVEALMESDLELPAIVQHFAAALQEAGWSPDRAGGADPVMWSTWRCTNEAGEPVDGFLLASRQPPNIYEVEVSRAVSPDAPERAEREDLDRSRASRDALSRDPRSLVVLGAPLAAHDADGLRELILRITAPANPAIRGYENPQLYAGHLPPSLPAELPLPPGVRVLGALELSTRIMMYLESEILPQDILHFYRHALPPDRWSFFGTERHTGGFIAFDMPEPASGLFCPLGDGPGIELSTSVWRKSLTELTLTLVLDLDSTPCRNADHPARWVYRGQQPSLPILVPPPDADLAGGGGSGSQISMEQRASLFTPLSIPEVVSWYAAQLAKRGWTEEGRSHDLVTGWSTWDAHDEVGGIHALFRAVRRPGTNRIQLLVRAVRA